MEVVQSRRRRQLSSSPPPVICLPPSEDVMAAWLYPIVSGQEPAGHDDDQPSDGDVAGHAAAVVDDAPADRKREKFGKMEDKCCRAEGSTSYSCGRKKATGGIRRSRSETLHSLAEKRRRCKINEKLKTLQQLVPGCDDKNSQASTLDQTIQYIKSLQQQIIQAMLLSGCGGGMKLPAVYPAVRPRYLPGVVPASPAPPAMVLSGPLLPMLHKAASSCCCAQCTPNTIRNHSELSSSALAASTSASAAGPSGARQNNSVSGNNVYSYID